VLTETGLAALEVVSPHDFAGVRHHLLNRLTPEQVRQMREISHAVTAPLL
jgi:hypothetical protein